MAQTFGSRSHFTEQGGAAIYASVCAACHMPDGRGASGAGRYPSLAQDPRLAAAAYPIAVVLLGQKAMPGFAETLSDQQIADTVTYIRTHFGNAFPDAVTAAEVAAVRPSR
jgi:mono/diheme cytochrome c family protein